MISELLKSYRQTEKLTLRELATKMGIGYVSLHRMEHGRPLNFEAVQAIMRWMWQGNYKKRKK